MLAMVVTGTPGDILGRLAELRAADANTVYFNPYDVTDTDHVRFLGREILPAGHPDLVPNERAHAHPPAPARAGMKVTRHAKPCKCPGRLSAVSGPAAWTSPHQALFQPRVSISQLSVVGCVSPSVALASELI